MVRTPTQTVAGIAFIGLGLATALSTSSVEAQCQYDVTIIQAPDCPPFGPQATFGTGINSTGDIAGYHCACICGSNRAFEWAGEAGGLVDLPMPGTTSSRAFDINDDGWIVGHHCVSGDGLGDLGFLWDGQDLINLGTFPTGTYSDALAINSLGQVVGKWGNVVIGDPARAAFLWQDGAMTDLNAQLGTPNSEAHDINDLGQVVGWMGNSVATDAHAFIWQDGDVTDLGVIPGGFSAVASAIDNVGRVVGWGREPLDRFPFATWRAFYWQGDEMIDLGSLSGFEHAAAFDIDDTGQIVGQAWGFGGNLNIQVGFVWQNGVMTDLNDLIPPNAGLEITSATAINNQGQITGQADTDSGDVVAFLLTPVAVPGDIDGDCEVGIEDFLAILGLWGPCPAPCPPTCVGDLDGDCNVGIAEFLLVLGNWGA